MDGRRPVGGRCPPSPVAVVSGRTDAEGSTPEVSVVIVAYRSGGHLDATLDALAAADRRPAFEVVLVDNACPDHSGEAAASAHPWVRLVRSATNTGFGGGCELGVLAARAPIICLLNPDVEVEPGWLGPLVDAVDAGAGAAASVAVDHGGRVLEAGGGIHGDAREPWTAPCPDAADRFVDYASAACLALRRSTFRAVGGFRADYWPAYFEDADLGVRLQAHGGVRVVAASRVLHHVGGDTALVARAAPTFAGRHAGFLDAVPRRALRGGRGAQIAVVDDGGDDRVVAALLRARAARPDAELLVLVGDERRRAGVAPAAVRVGAAVLVGPVAAILDDRWGELDTIVFTDAGTGAAHSASVARSQPQAVVVTEGDEASA